MPSRSSLQTSRASKLSRDTKCICSATGNGDISPTLTSLTTHYCCQVRATHHAGTGKCNQLPLMWGTHLSCHVSMLPCHVGRTRAPECFKLHLKTFSSSKTPTISWTFYVSSKLRNRVEPVCLMLRCFLSATRAIKSALNSGNHLLLCT